MRRALLLLCACLFGCGVTLGEDALDVIEVGTPVDASQQSFIPNLLRDVRLLVGPDGVPWLAEPIGLPALDPMDMPDPRGGISGSYFMHRLQGDGEPRSGYLVPEQKLSLFPPTPAQSICAYRENPGNTTEPYLVSFRRADQQTVTEFATGPSEPLVLCGQRTMVFFQPSKDNLYFDILRRGDDGKLVHSRIPWPADARPDLQQGPLGFDDSEKVVFVNDGDYRTQVHYLDSPGLVDIGVLYWGQAQNGRFISIDLDGFVYVYHIAERLRQSVGFRLGPNGQLVGYYAAGNEVVSCDWDGLRAVTLPRPGEVPPVIAPQRVLDRAPCTTSASQLPALTSLILYTPIADPPGSEVRSVRVDSNAPPKVLIRQQTDDSLRVLGICQDRAVPYTLDPPDRYGPSVNDGWLGGYRFMERGRDVRFAPDCSRIFFKEHAANVRRLGELRAQIIPPNIDSGIDPAEIPAPKRLARNAGFNRVTPDGRLLAVTDLSVVGPQNRLQLIDDRPGEAKGIARSILHSVNAVTGALFVGNSLPGRRELVLEIKDTDPGRQAGLLLVTLPPPEQTIEPEIDVPPR